MMASASQLASLCDLIMTRRSVRRFASRAVPRELIEGILEAATHAPNAHNRQPWRFVVLETAAPKARLAEAMAADFRNALLAEGLSEADAQAQIARSKARITEAPVAIVLCMLPELMDKHSDLARQEGEYLMAAQSTALAGGYLLLAAHAKGLGGVWMCAPLFVPETVAKALDLPESWVAQALLVVGYPAGEPKARARIPLEEVTVYR